MKTAATNTVWMGSGRARRHAGERGMTLLITLGFLSVLMMLALTFAITSRTERKTAAASADLVRTRLLAESAIERVKAQMQSDFVGKVYPGDEFLNTTSGPWQGRPCLPSRHKVGSTIDTTGIEDALGSTSGELQYTPNAPLHPEASWIPVTSARNINGVDRNVLIGRYAYVLMDDSGKIDPSAVVDVSSAEASRSTPRTGASVTDINLGDAGIANANKFRPDTVTYGEEGKMPADARWFSLAHMVRAMQPDQSQFNQIVKTLYPFSRDVERFWRDANNNGTWDPGEDVDRLNIASRPTLEQIYNAFVGPNKAGDMDVAQAALDDDCAWLKDLDHNAWFQEWKNSALAGVAEPLRTAQARQLAAAQVAANIVDYADLDSTPTRVYLDTGGNIMEGTYAGTFNMSGIEATWGVSEIALHVEADQFTTVNPEGGGEVAADDRVDFELTNGTAVPQESFTASVTVLGSHLVNWGYRQKATVQVMIGGDTYEPFGPYAKAVTGNVGDDNNPRTAQIDKEYPAGTPISVRVKFWKKSSTSYSGTQNTHWTNSRTVHSANSSDFCRSRLLRNNSPVPNEPGFQGQQDASYYLASYIDGNAMRMTDNQSIWLFEHTDSLGGSGADFQDAVVLVTLTPGSGEPPAPEPEPYDFTITNGTSVPTGRFFLHVDVLGSNLVNWGYRQPCTVKVKVGGNWYEPWGNYGTPVGSNVGDDNNPRHYEFADAFDKDTPVSVQVKFWKKTSTSHSGNQNSHWETSREVYSANSSHFNRTKVLRNGDPVPAVAGFQNQSSAAEYVKDYINGGYMSMAPDQAIYLFEHTSDLGGSGADFQDAVILVTMIDERIVLAAQNPPPPAPENPGTPADPNVGDALRFRLGVKGEIFYPFATGANSSNPPGPLTVTCSAEVNTATGQTKRITLAHTVNMSQVANTGGGTAMYSADFDYGEWVEIPNAFDQSTEPPLNWYTVSLMQVDNITLKDGAGNIIDSFPANGSFFCNWSQNGISTDDASFYVSARALDPLMNDRSANDPDFHRFWSVYPNSNLLAESQEAAIADIGTLTHGGYAGTPYGDIEVKNGPILRLGELGRVHSYAPLQSLRLWAANSSDAQGSDAAIMDVFRTASGLERRGKVNINTREPDVLKALFADATTVNPTAAANAVLAARASGTVFTNIGQVFGTIHGISGSNKSDDKAEEEAVGKIAELITCRQNYFTVIACAQAIQDVAGVPYKNGGEETPRVAAYNQFDVKRNADGTVAKYIDKILAEQKMQIVVYRDAFSNRMQVERIEYLHE